MSEGQEAQSEFQRYYAAVQQSPNSFSAWEYTLAVVNKEVRGRARQRCLVASLSSSVFGPFPLRPRLECRLYELKARSALRL